MPVGERIVLLYSPVSGSTTQLERNYLSQYGLVVSGEVDVLRRVW
jgi:hypothetical protein